MLEFAGDREFLDLLCRPACETMLVVEILPPRGKGEPIIRLKLSICGDSLPLDGSSAFLIPAVVIISRQTELGCETVSCDRVRHVTPIRRVGYLRPADIGFRRRKLRRRLHGHLTNDGLFVDRRHCIIPTIDDKAGERNLVIHVICGTHTHVVERNGQ